MTTSCGCPDPRKICLCGHPETEHLWNGWTDAIQCVPCCAEGVPGYDCHGEFTESQAARFEHQAITGAVS